MTAPLTTNIPSPALHKTHFSSLFLLPRIKSLRKQGTEGDLIIIQYGLHYELLLMSVPRGWGEKGLDGIPMEGCLLKWIGVGGSDIWRKTINVCMSILQFA